MEYILSSPTVKTRAAELGIIGDNTFADLEALDIFAECGYDTDGFVSCAIELDTVQPFVAKRKS